MNKPIKVTKHAMSELEWCAGRMAHLRVKGTARTLCGADPTYFNVDRFWRPTLSKVEADEKHKCKNCLKRVK